MADSLPLKGIKLTLKINDCVMDTANALMKPVFRLVDELDALKN
jgi:hypothetical protein